MGICQSSNKAKTIKLDKGEADISNIPNIKSIEQIINQKDKTTNSLNLKNKGFISKDGKIPTSKKIDVSCIGKPNDISSKIFT